MTRARDAVFVALDQLVGTWTTEATHPTLPGVVVHGMAVFEWLDGEQFLIVRSHMDHPDFPDALSVLGRMGRDRVDADGAIQTDSGPPALGMHYFDSRGVFRAYAASVDAPAWRWWRNAPGFSQRFTGRLVNDGNMIDGRSELCRDDIHWADDLQITYRRWP